MERSVCRACGRETYLVADLLGEIQELDATASVHWLRTAPAMPDYSEPASDAFVLHRFTCRAELFATLTASSSEPTPTDARRLEHVPAPR